MKKVGRPISLLKYLWSAIWGSTLGLVAVLLHNTLIPIGLILTLTSEAIVIWYVGRLYGAKRFKLITAISWLAVVIKGGTPGAGNEVLVMGDSIGIIFLLAGMAVAVFTVMRKI